jgi:hypothetical protein
MAEHAARVDGRVRVSATARSRASPAELFAVLLDTERWPEWSTVTGAAVERPGGPDGLGLIRRLRTGPILVREEVVEAERDRRQVYVQLTGLPIEDYRAEVRLDPALNGAVVTWSASFRARRAAWFWRAFMQLAMSGFAKRLARAVRLA